ncbi:[protein-PII] uridylyltransferase family protein [Calycomorphotria hydatis]|uniref:Glutamate-ammonia-ligase adenylyltransferase n=1 Tax=Calycomorphotria hydatis TaxID=2528027 RepID=A0A517TEY1_9PLAN|nr:glutamine synthetase adenylyltransferase [Calycomorphotria hydatis]QDT66925.1 Glutamate-ammonia-ligase adenylyltransferase [Calycomorphotria hydatis]
MFQHAPSLLRQDGVDDAQTKQILEAVGFADESDARKRLRELCVDEASLEALGRCLPMLLACLAEAATPDGSLINFERYVQSFPDRTKLFEFLAERPRAIEILVRLFINSHFLTEILLRNPDYLERLTNHKRIAEVKAREHFYEEACAAAENANTQAAELNALRRYQHWELLRIGACDSFGLLDLKTVTVQLSLLADSLVQACLTLSAKRMEVDTTGFCVIAFGKLGGEELNYSSDIDLVFLAAENSTRFWPLGQKLIKALMESTGEGFLYRVDMRLRPWGKSGALVNDLDAHLVYLERHGQPWEKQALLKARVIAGEFDVGNEFLKKCEPLIYSMPAEQVRKTVRDSKQKIEAALAKKGRHWGEVKSGAGSIRDIEFVAQGLQLLHGGEEPGVRSINTLDALVRLADRSYLQADEFRQLSSGYNFLRTVEHSLQLMHYKQTHSLPNDERELTYLAKRLDYTDGEHFLNHYERHVNTIRGIYMKYVGGEDGLEVEEQKSHKRTIEEQLARMEESYKQVFSDDDIALHAELLSRLEEDNRVEVFAQHIENDLWRLTVVGQNSVGDLSAICGLLFVYGFDIKEGHVFTDSPVSGVSSTKRSAGIVGEFVNVFTVQAPLPQQELEEASTTEKVWHRYAQDLTELVNIVTSGHWEEAQGKLAKRVSKALRTGPLDAGDSALLPVEIEIDNESSDRYTVLHIRAEDTTGFLYELSNALAVADKDIGRVIVRTSGSRVFDTLYVTNSHGQKITSEDAQRELRATVVLIKHFTHLLPRSSNPEAALQHFREFVVQLFQQDQWVQNVASLERPEVLTGLAQVFGGSDFLWEDFLRLQYTNLFPVVTDVEGLTERKTRAQLKKELQAELGQPVGQNVEFGEVRKERLNAFKDREMFRVDMRHIVGHIPEFGQFSNELTDIAETVVEGALNICIRAMKRKYGLPFLEGDLPCRLSICALGKCGGRELGFASDIELMFIFEGAGRTSGMKSVRNIEYFTRLVEMFNGLINARQEGIFQIDLRLRPYGQAGSSGVRLDAFEKYYAPHGPAWPFERQALVKLRPIAGDPHFGDEVIELRDRLIYTVEPFDVTAMKAMREKQLRQLVQAGTINAKLSLGGLVDTEYIVQGLQITHGNRSQKLRQTNTVAAMAALHDAKIINDQAYETLKSAYIFQRELIDALRMVRGHAKDLTVPSIDDEQFEFLARRLGYAGHLTRLKSDIEQHSTAVLGLMGLLEGGSGVKS